MINQINVAIAGGAGQWTLGSGFWDLLKVVTIELSQRFFDALLGLLSSLDCIICAIAGNVVGDFFCSAPLYKLFHDLLTTFDTLVVTIVSFAIDLVKFIIFFFYYLFSGQWAALGQLVVDFLLSVWHFVANVVETVVGFFLGTICICSVWPFDWPSPCNNADYCAAKKRFIAQAEYGPTTVADANYTYQVRVFLPRAAGSGTERQGAAVPDCRPPPFWA